MASQRLATYALDGKVVVVTGGGQGIGRGCCLELARLGAAVAVLDINPATAEATAALARQAGGTAIACQGDVASTEDVERILAAVRAELGPITVLVNNAAIVEFTPFQEITQASFERLCRVNLIAPFMLIQQTLPDMLAARWGRVINISSASAQRGTPRLAHYAATKGGMMAFTRTLALEYAETGVTVNNVSPCFIDTEMRLGSGGNFEAAVAATPMKRPGTPADVAGVVAFLASDASSYITGQTLGVNGGLVLS